MGQPCHPLVSLARQAIKTYLEKGKLIEPPDQQPSEGREKSGVFVCLKSGGNLRGCIGTYEPSTGSVSEEVIVNAVSAAVKDSRFMPVTLSELNDLSISVDILSKPERIHSMDELDPKKYGIIVKSHGRCGLLLPDIEGIDSREAQVAIARRKAGIEPGEPAELFRFEVKRYK